MKEYGETDFLQSPEKTLNFQQKTGVKKYRKKRTGKGQIGMELALIIIQQK